MASMVCEGWGPGGLSTGTASFAARDIAICLSLQNATDLARSIAPCAILLACIPAAYITYSYLLLRSDGRTVSHKPQ